MVSATMSSRAGKSARSHRSAKGTSGAVCGASRSPSLPGMNVWLQRHTSVCAGLGASRAIMLEADSVCQSQSSQITAAKHGGALNYHAA